MAHTRRGKSAKSERQNRALENWQRAETVAYAYFTREGFSDVKYVVQQIAILESKLGSR
jgi:hypothetical protein